MSDFITPEAWEAALSVLRAVAEDPTVAPDLPALERAVQPIARQARRRRRSDEPAEEERQRREEQSRVDRTARAAQDQSALRATTMHQIHHGAESPAGESGVLVRRAHACHICGERYRDLDAFYHRLCPACAAENMARRRQRADLSGRTALVTGGRVKIGHATALRLLQNGARVIVTSRFPHEAAHRFSQAADFADWRERLQIYGLNFLDLRCVLAFADRLLSDLSSLDILINNAAQTVKRPPAFYAPALAYEAGAAGLPLPALALIAQAAFAEAPLSSGSLAVWSGPLDRHGQPEDARESNSWTLRSHEVSPSELLEVLVVNAAAPCILTSQLKPLMMRSPHRQRFVINATGLDGRFDAPDKSPRHPHVNMSKAALNMLTRTASADYASDGISMNSVDTGWVSDEAGYSAREARREAGWVPPLDEIDAAARLCAPIFDGIHGAPASGTLFRHYRPAAW